MAPLKCRSALAGTIVLLLAAGAARAEEAAPAAAAPPAQATPAGPAAPPAQTTPAAPATVPPPPAAATAPVATPPAAAPMTAPAPPADSLPGSGVFPGPGMSPQAPPVSPAPGGRAPSFGAPTEKSAAQFRIGGRFFGYQMVGIGHKPGNPPAGYSGLALHAPSWGTGKIPFWGGSGATINLEYGTPSLKAYVTYYFRLNRTEYMGYNNPQMGPGFGIAYLLLSPDPIGKLRLQFKVGSFVDVYAGPGQWGWGIFGPMLALKGWGETALAEWEATRDLRLSITHGVLVNPGVAEGYPRGDYNPWIETGTSTWVHHAHLGAVYKAYTFKLHYASVYGTDDRKYLLNFLNQHTTVYNPATGKDDLVVAYRPDGRMDTLLAEVHWQENPWGQVGLTGGLYNFDKAAAVGNGVWWAVDWTQGAREMIQKYLGPLSGGTGKVAVLSAEYNFSVSSMLWHPRSFNGKAPDIRVGLAAMLTRTVATPDPFYKNAMGYFFGVDTEYRMTRYWSLAFQTYGEDREGSTWTPDPTGVKPGVPYDPNNPPPYIPIRQRWRCYSLNPGIAFHTDWTSLDRIQLIYSRRFYSAAADNNSAQPFDHHAIAVGGYVTF